MKPLLRFKTFLLLAIFSLLAGTSAWAQGDFSAVETSNVTLTAGTNGSSVTVNGNAGIKVGTSSKGGDMSVTVPAGTTHLHLHAAAWKGVTGLSLNISGATASPASISLTADAGISNNSPFTLSGNASDFYFVVELSGITSTTTVKFTTSTTKRFVIWGVNAEEVSSGDTRVATTTTFPQSSYQVVLGETFTAPTATVSDVSGSPISGATVSYESDNTGVASVNASTGEVTVVGEGTATITATYAGDNTNYKGSSGSYTLTVAAVYDIAGIKALADNTTAVLNLVNAKVLAVSGTQYIWIRDDSGALLIYGSGLNYTAGQVLNGTATVKKTTYRGQVETTGTIDGSNIVATSGDAPVPVDVDEANAMNYDSDLVKLSNVSVSNGVIQGVNDLTIFDSRFSLGYTFDETKTYNIVGIIGVYNTTNQIYPISAEEYSDPGDTRAEPELAFSSSTAEAAVGQSFTAPTLSAAAGFTGPVEYESSDDGVATIMDTETGEVRPNKAGTAVITATFAGDNNFKPGSASYTLTVTDNRIATTITQENIILDIADVATLTKLAPVVKDVNDNIVAYTYGEWPTEVSFEIVEDNDYLIGYLDNNSGDIILNAVTGTATLKAYYNYFNVNGTYQPSECTFTITVESPLNGISEFCTLTSGTSGKLKLTDAVVLYVKGNDMFVKDATGAIDFYNTGLTYTEGNVLNGSITATYKLYNNMPELTTPIANNTLVATDGTAVTPTEITADLAADYACDLVKISGVNVTSSNNKFYVGDSGVQIYDKFKLNYAIEAGKTYDIVGIMIPYNSIYEICPIEAPTEVAVTTPSITVEPDTYTLDAKAGGGVLPVVCENLAADPQLAVVFVEADGQTPATYDWITATINSDGNIDGQITANTSDAPRTAYFYVTGVDADNNTVYSNLVTFTQNGRSIEVKGTLEFTAEGGGKTVNIEYGGLENPAFEVRYYEADGATSATYDWVSATITSENKIDFTIANNTGAARTAYFKVYDTVSGLYSNFVAINQAAATVPVIVVNPKGLNTEYYVQATSLNDIEDGDAIMFVESQGSSYMGMTTFDVYNPAFFGSVTFPLIYPETSVQLTASEAADLEKFVVKRDGDKFYFYASRSGINGFLSARSNTEPAMLVSDQPESDAAITFDNDGNATVVFQNSAFAYNILGWNTSTQWNCYNAATGVIKIFVENPVSTPVSGDYVKVTSTSDLTDGEYLIVYEDGSLAFDGSLSALDVAQNTVSVTIDNNTIASTAAVDAATFTIDVAAGTIQSASGLYIGQTSDANGLKGSAETAYTNSISIDADGNAVIVSSSGPYLRYNAGSGQERFRYFKSSTYSAQKAIQLYKKASGPAPSTPSITISPDTYEMDAKAGGGVLPVVCTNLAADPQLAVVFVESDGVTPATYDWITATINSDGNIDGNIQANTGAPRTAYFKVSGKDDAGNTVYSNLVTFTQNGPSIEVNSPLDIPVEGENKTININYGGLVSPVFEVRYFEADGTTSATYPWVSTEITSDEKINMSVEPNTGDARTAYFKVYDTVSGLYSNLVTVNQAAPAVDYVTLPFNWAGGSSADFKAIGGVTTNGLGSDYASSNAPYLIKLDGDGDYIEFKTNERPGVVTIEVKMLGGPNTSTITVAGSPDGQKFMDIETLSISGSVNDIVNLETTNSFAASDRYIRLTFTKGSNVGVGPITIAQYVEPVQTPSITISPDTYEMDAKAGGGVLPVVCTNLAADPQLAVVFVESDGVTPATYDWITATINSDGNIDGNIQANTGAPRTAYFKVSGKDDAGNTVYSNLVTFTQNGPSIEVKGALAMAAAGETRKVNISYGGLVSPVFEIRYFEADGTTSATYPWVSAEITSDEKINVTVEANTGAERTAYFKVYDTVSGLSSNLVLIKQEAAQSTTTSGVYAKVTSNSDIEDGKNYILVYRDDSQGVTKVFTGNVSTTSTPYGLSADASYDGSNGTVDVSSVTDFVPVVINSSTDGFTMKVGDKYLAWTGGNSLKTRDDAYSWSINVDSPYETSASTPASSVVATTDGARYILYNTGSPRFACYASSSTVSGSVSLYKEVSTTPSEEIQVVITSAGYSTLYYSDKSLKIPANSSVRAYTITFDTNAGKIVDGDEFAPGDVIPANMPVVLEENNHEAVNIQMQVVNDPEYQPIYQNYLVGYDYETDLTKVVASPADYKFYKLSGSPSGKVGFFWATTDGGPFVSAAHKAALILPKSLAGNIRGFEFGGDSPTAIQNVEKNADSNGKVYDLQGRRVQNAGKGIYIINGKKVIK